jgi:nucleoside-diphosphate-sugar epimerase
MTRRVLITGGSGVVGPHLVEYLRTGDDETELRGIGSGSAPPGAARLIYQG